ncbi:MAG TPA: protein kinase [Thermoanaerobaculia bacterium]
MAQPLTLVEGKYEVLSKIREGGMGTIYKVRHRLLDEIRVIKVMRPNVAADEEFKRRFVDEARTATRLKHPNICAIYDFALDPDGASSLVMEYIDGVTLSDLLRAQKVLDLGLALEITHQALMALGYLHRKRIVHRDVAPDNLMLTVDEEGKSVVKLIDLGIAKVLDRGGGEMTSTGQFLGKLRYASPEQYGSLAKGTQIDGRSDIYSMGLVLYELATGVRPFSGETPIELMRAHVYEDPLPFEKSDPKGLVPEEVRQMVFRAIRKNREERFASAQEFDYAVVAAFAHIDRQVAEEEGPTMILGAKARARPHDPSPTPSAQDRLDFQFAPQTTPTRSATTPLPPAEELAELAARAAEAQQRQKQEVDRIREGESRGDRIGLQGLLDSGSFSPSGMAELRSVIERLAQKEAAEAKRREESDWSSAGDSGSAAGWERYIASHPDSPRRANAERARDEARDFETASSQDTEGGWRSFLERWPSGARVSEASLRLKGALQREEAAWKAANEDGTAAVLLQFLAVHPSGKHHHEAEGLLRELSELDEAASAGPEGYRRFLKRYPTSRHARSARHKLRELEESALLAEIQQHEADLNEGELEKLLLRYPPGSTVVGTAASEALGKARAEIERRRLQAEEEDWARARAAAREDDWARFLRKHPDSRHAEEARRALATAIEARQRVAEEQAALERIQQLESAGAEADLVAIRDKQPRDSSSPLGAAAAASVERVRTERERRRHKAEEARWLEAAAGGEAQWQAFLDAHPDSPYAETARRNLAEAAEVRSRAEQEAALLARVREHEAALAEDALERLARSVPESADAVRSEVSAALTRVRESLARRGREAEEADWTSAKASGRSDTWQRFLDRHPSTSRSKEARRLLARARKVERAKAAAESGQPTSRRALVLVLGLVGVAVVIAIGALLWPRARVAPPAAQSAAVAPRVAEPRAEQPTAAPEEARQPSPAPPSPPPVAVGPPGVLAFNALPWGRVDRIVDASGRSWNDGLPQYTPVSLALPPGRYTLTVSNPDYPSGLSIEVEVRSNEASTETGTFETMDPKTYFRSQGWGG